MKNIIIILFAVIFTGCLPYDFSRPVVQQGNLLSQSEVSRLKIGMSKEDAAILMGTSLLSPTFNLDRWDYTYFRQVRGKTVAARTVSLYFQNGRLVRVERKI